MEEKKELLLKLILKENISAIVTMSEKLGVKPDDVIAMLKELLNEDRLAGTLTEDQSRFFKNTVRVSSAPVIPREEKLPKFMSYNTRSGKIVAVVGFIVLAVGVIINVIAIDIQEQNFAALLILVGILVFLVGLYLIARRGAPS